MFCTVITYSIVWINRVRLPILLVISWTGKINVSLSPFAPEKLVSRDRLGRPAPRQPNAVLTIMYYQLCSTNYAHYQLCNTTNYVLPIMHTTWYQLCTTNYVLPIMHTTNYVTLPIMYYQLCTLPIMYYQLCNINTINNNYVQATQLTSRSVTP